MGGEDYDFFFNCSSIPDHFNPEEKDAFFLEGVLVTWEVMHYHARHIYKARQIESLPAVCRARIHRIHDSVTVAARRVLGHPPIGSRPFPALFKFYPVRP